MSKRYKLKKDLPTFKAGDKFWLNKYGDLFAEKRDENGYFIPVYSERVLKKFPNILRDWFEEIPERTKTVWDLEYGDTCWIVDTSDDSAFCIDWEKMYEPERSCGDIFLTEYEAKCELARRKAKQILLRDTKGYRPVLKSNVRDKYHVYWLIDPGCFGIDCESNVIEDRIYFGSEEDARASIEAHPDEWKTYLGVEEQK